MQRPGWNGVLLCLLCTFCSTGCDTNDPNNEAQVSVQDIIVGEGAVAEGDKIVTVEYTGTLISGDVFDTTRRDDRKPLSFQLETGLVEDDPQGGQVIDGFIQGVPGMQVGGLRRITVPPQLAWGSRGAGCKPENPHACIIPPNSTLLFEIELIAVREGGLSATHD